MHQALATFVIIWLAFFTLSPRATGESVGKIVGKFMSGFEVTYRKNLRND